MSAIGNKAEINCTGKVTINALGDSGSYAVGARSQADEGTLIIRNASAVEINAPQYNQVIGGWKGIADITCNGPVTIRGNAEGGKQIANSFTFRRTDCADYVYFTSEDAETEASEGSGAPIPADAPYTVAGVGRYEFPLAALAIIDGGHVRVGFEDNVYLSKGVPAKSNGELVEKVVRMAKEFGREVATPDEARRILGLKK